MNSAASKSHFIGRKPVEPELRRAAQYVRMSTDHQRYSIESQISAIAEYALCHDMEVVRTYADEGRSGVMMKGRDGLKRLIADVQEGHANFDVILVYDVSRWGRFQDADESVRRVEIRADCVKIDICRSGLAELLSASSVDLSGKDRKPTNTSDQVITLMAPVRLKRVGREMKMLVEDSNDDAAADLSLLRIIARAHDIQERLVQNTKLSVHDIARAERVTAAYIYTLLRLPWLAPDIITAVVNGRQPPQLNAKKLMRVTAHLPTDWAEQRALLGFR